MRNYRDISYILNERGFNVHHLTPSKLLSPHTEFLVLLMIRLSVSFYTGVFIIIMVLTFSKTKFTCRHIECVLLGSNLIKQKFKREIISTGF